MSIGDRSVNKSRICFFLNKRLIVSVRSVTKRPTDRYQSAAQCLRSTGVKSPDSLFCNNRSMLKKCVARKLVGYIKTSVQLNFRLLISLVRMENF